MQRLITMKQDDQDWRGGRVFSLVYSAGDDVHELLSDALSLYSAENGLNVLAFPSIGVMQHDIVSQHRHAARRGRPGRGWRRRGLPDLGRHREPAPGGQDGPRRRPRARHRPAERRGRRECARRLHQGRRLLRRGPGPRPCRTRTTGSRPVRWPRPAPTTRSWSSAPRPTYPQGVIDPIADIAATRREARHPVPRRRLHGRLPPALPRPSWAGSTSPSTSASRA